MSRYYEDEALTLLQGDAAAVLATLEAGSVNCVVTSPPYYGLRDYGVDGQLGLEPTPDEYVAKTVDIFREVRRVLADDGAFWLNLGDSYAYPPGSAGRQGPGRRKGRFTAEGLPGTRFMPPKNLLGIPWRTALALQADGWILRNAIVWHKPNAMPETVTDRLAQRYETVFLLTKSPRYWFDLDPIREPHSDRSLAAEASARRRPHQPGKAASQQVPSTSGFGAGLRELHPLGRNPGDVWSISTQPYRGAHSAPMPLLLAHRCVLAGCKPGGTVLDPFCGTGTSLLAAQQSGRRGVGIDLNPDYLKLALQRCQQAPLALDDGGAA